KTFRPASLRVTSSICRREPSMSRTSRSRIEPSSLAIAALLLAVTLGGCSSLYTERRETISSLTGDALAVNRATQMVDPWSPASANRNIAFNGEKMQTASERYRMNRVIPPVNATTSSLNYQQAAQAAQSTQQSSTTGSAPAVK